MLTTFNEPGQEFAGGIRFTMMDGVIPVNCWITREALDDIEDGKPSQELRIARFERHRFMIERVAGQKYVGGERAPIVMTFDLETSG